MDLTSIENNVITWVEQYLPGFTFRQYQKEYIIDTINSILEGDEVNIIEAPTGSGKSVIIIIMAGVLEKFYQKNSFILCSDLYLWGQYADFITKNNLYFGMLKGKENNFQCSETGQEIKLAPCQLAKIPYKNLYDDSWCANRGWMCALCCEYIQMRKKAQTAPVTLLTYQLYLEYMNTVGADSIKNPFPPRSIIFCDECHNIPSICQNYGAITLDQHYDLNMLQECMSYINDKKLDMPGAVSTDETIQTVKNLYIQIQQTSYTNKEAIKNFLISLKNTYKSVVNCYVNAFKTYCNNNLTKLKAADYKALHQCENIYKKYQALKLYLEFAEPYTQYIVKDDTVTDKVITTTLKFAREDQWVYSFLLKHQKSAVMLSATVGGHRAFSANIGVQFLESKRSRMSVIPSTFDFSASPIFYAPKYKLSQNLAVENLPKIISVIESIVSSNKHINQRGIIHTGSYKYAADVYKYIRHDIKKRIFMYTNPKEKAEIMEKYMKSTNGILIGPTLSEGINLPGDLCRFIIIMKMPYPYLGDNLVKAKMELLNGWYNAETSKTVIQSIGRGNRTADDWCVTYILDGNFGKLYESTQEQYPPEMKSRFKIINV